MARTAASTVASGACSAEKVIKQRASTRYAKGTRSEKHKAFIAVLATAQEQIAQLQRENDELKRENVLLKTLRASW